MTPTCPRPPLPGASRLGRPSPGSRAPSGLPLVGALLHRVPDSTHVAEAVLHHVAATAADRLDPELGAEGLEGLHVAADVRAGAVLGDELVVGEQQRAFEVRLPRVLALRVHAADAVPLR